MISLPGSNTAIGGACKDERSNPPRPLAEPPLPSNARRLLYHDGIAAPRPAKPAEDDDDEADEGPPRNTWFDDIVGWRG